MLDMVHIGDNLKQIRERRYLTQRQLAKRAGLSPDTVVKIELDRVEPRPGTILKLAEALEVHPDQLTGFGEDE